VVRSIQEGGEISEDLKKDRVIFFPINDSESHKTADSGTHWTLLVLYKVGNILSGYHYNSSGSSIPTNVKKLTNNLRTKLNLKEEVIIYLSKNLPQQTNGADCGIYVITFTRALVKRFQEDTSFHD